MGWPSKVGSDPLATPPCSANTMFPKVSLRNWGSDRSTARRETKSPSVSVLLDTSQADRELSLIPGSH
jgi:hypothetical protein